MKLIQKIEAFELSSDIFLYPDENWFKKLKILSSVWALSIPDISLEEICSYYIEHFDINSTFYKTTPLASYWLNGKYFGNSSKAIENFYKLCGYSLSEFQSPCHISNMLGFCAILLRDEKYEEYKKFTLWLNWLKKYRLSLEKLDIKVFSQVIKLCEDIIFCK